MRNFISFLIFTVLFLNLSSYVQKCVNCHKLITPNIVTDWQLSKHSVNDVDCSVCHGDKHSNAKNVDQAELPTPETCRTCHETQVEQFSKVKHSLAWTSMYAMPSIHMQPMSLIDGMKGRGGCHKIGLKSDDDIKKLKAEGSG